MDRHIKSWDCCVCGKNLKQTHAQCYNDRKYCPGECIETIIERDENMELYRVIEKRYTKREEMLEKINAKYTKKTSRITEPLVKSEPLNIPKLSQHQHQHQHITTPHDETYEDGADDAHYMHDTYIPDLFFC